MNTNSIKYAVQSSAETRYVKNREATSFKDFFSSVLEPQRVSPEKDGQTFTPSFFRGPERNIENVIATSMVIFDVDQKPGDDIITLEETEDALIDMGLEHAIYTSYSNSADCPRFRIVLPLNKPAYPEEFLSVSAAALEALDDLLDYRLLKVIDGCWRETSRCYYTFTSHPDRLNGSISFYNPGAALDVLELKLAQSTYGIDAEYTKTSKPRAPGTAVGAQGRSMELNRLLGGLFRSDSEENIVKKIFLADDINNLGNQYFRDQSYARNRPRPGESSDAAAFRACKAWVRSHLNWLRRKWKGSNDVVVDKKATSKDPMPTHDAQVEIKAVKMGKTKSGAETALLELKIRSGDHAGRHFWHRLYGAGNHPVAVDISNQMISKIMTAAHESPNATIADLHQAVNCILPARIKKKEGTNGFPAQNELGTVYTQA